MKRRFSGSNPGFTQLCLVLSCALALPLAGTAAQALDDPSAGILQDALPALGLKGGELIEIVPSATASGTLQFVVHIDGTPETIELTPVSIRSPEYTVLVQRPDGTLERIDPAPERNYRGTVIGSEGSVVAATLSDTGLRGSIHLPDGSRRWIEPVDVQIAAGAPGQHILYRDEDLLEEPDTCAEPIVASVHEDEPVGSVAGASGLFVAQLALDADYEYYMQYGSVAAVQDQINTVINTMNVEYERDVQIRHIITTIIVRTTATDPYSATDAGMLLDQFRNQWVTNHASIQRDVAQLFTGRNIDSSVIGVAYLGEICTSSAYGVVESNYSGCTTLACKTDLSAHELGHNWNAQHCSCANPPYTMNPSITGANRFHPTYSIPSIVAYRDTRGCLDIGDELLRVIMSMQTTTLEVGQSAQVQAIADFRYGSDQVVTTQATWSVDRPEFASISNAGLLTIHDADAESCVSLGASYTYEGVTKTAIKQITAIDPTDLFALVASNPPTDAIDARRPTRSGDAVPVGWSSFELTLNSEPCLLSPTRFSVMQQGGTAAPPAILSVTPMGGKVVRLTLDKPLDPGAWTTIEDTLSGVSLRIGYLPGDVNGNGATTPADILTLINGLNGLESLAPWSGDIDRSGDTAPADIIELIDLLNGTNGTAAWNGAFLP